MHDLWTSLINFSIVEGSHRLGVPSKKERNDYITVYHATKPSVTTKISPCTLLLYPLSTANALIKDLSVQNFNVKI